MTTSTTAAATELHTATATVTGLTISSPDRELVHDVSFSIGRGERVGLIGESGSGKSLTSSAVCGLLPGGLSAQGSIRLSGVEHDMVATPDRLVRRLRGNRVSMIFQEPMTALDPTMRVGRQVAEAIGLHQPHLSGEQVRTRVLELFQEVRLPDPPQALTAYPHEISGGQRQRVVMAMALANNPSLIVADEPTTALDVTVQAQVLDLLDDVVTRHESSLLFITHDLSVVARLCDRVLVMFEGRIVEQGDVEQVLGAPQHQYTRRLVAASSLGPRRAAHPPEKEGSNEAVEIDNVTRTFGSPATRWRRHARQVHALKGLSLTVRRGERLGIVGESGSGKTTLIKMIAGLEHPTSGTVHVGREQVSNRPEHRLKFLREQVQFVFQDPMASLDPRMTVRQIIAEPLRGPRAQIDARVDELLHAVALPADAAERYPHQFSGGQRQRINIARALAPRPQVLIADEPVSALDVSVRAQVLALLDDLVAQHGLTLIFVSHDLGVVRHLCDRVAVMYHGELVELAPTDHVYSDAAKPYTKALIEASSSVQDALARRAALRQG